MPSWDDRLYLRFAGERTRPAVELADRVAVEAPQRVVDLGCGPGTSTEVLAWRWPRAALTGIDTSEAMLAAARASHPDWHWQRTDLARWTAEKPVDVIFSNAALQWVEDHARQFPRLLAQVAPGGALAVQVPANVDARPHAIMREVAALPEWRPWFTVPPRTWHVHTAEYYYDLLAPHAAHLDIWTTEYLHVLDGVEAIVEWYRGSGLRPWLDALPDEARRTAFLAAYREALHADVPVRRDGSVLLPFRRLFVVAYP